MEPPPREDPAAERADEEGDSVSTEIFVNLVAALFTMLIGGAVLAAFGWVVIARRPSLLVASDHVVPVLKMCFAFGAFEAALLWRGNFMPIRAATHWSWELLVWVAFPLFAWRFLELSGRAHGSFAVGAILLAGAALALAHNLGRGELRRMWREFGT